jgi:anthranilate phosphoribosyltransferase
MRSARFVPQLYALKALRDEIALRSGISTVEKIYNLAGARYNIIGLTHLPYLERMMGAAKEMGFQRVLIVQGIEGNEDAPTSRPCRAVLWEGGETRELQIDASEYGLQPASREEMAGGDAEHSARIAESILAGEGGGHRDLVLLNAGLRIWLAERAVGVGEGIERAREAIDSGAAKAKLDALRDRAARRAGA